MALSGPGPRGSQIGVWVQRIAFAVRVQFYGLAKRLVQKRTEPIWLGIPNL